MLTSPNRRARARARSLAARALSLGALALFSFAAIKDTADERTARKVANAVSSPPMRLKGAASLAPRSDEPAWFCHGGLCPPFKVLASEKSYEVRAYEASTWVMTSVNASTAEVAAARGIVPLLQYTAGANERHAPLLSGPPSVLTFHANADYTRTDGTFDVALYLPDQPDGLPLPAPSPDVDVTIAHRPPRTVYVYQFGGWARGSVAMSNAARLALALTQDGRPFEAGGSFGLALYDGPRRFVARHNEVWLQATPAGAPNAAASVTGGVELAA